MFYRYFNKVWQLMAVFFCVGVNPKKWRKTFLVY